MLSKTRDMYVLKMSASFENKTELFDDISQAINRKAPQKRDRKDDFNAPMVH